MQEHIVTVAEETTAVAAASDAVERGDARFETAAAKLLANQAAHKAVRSAHQAHGAIGMTREYPLHYTTRRLQAWRREYGD